MPRTNLAWLVTLALSASVTSAAAVGCGAGASSDTGGEEIDNGFESDDPSGRTAASRGEGTSADAGAASASPSAGSDSKASGDAARAVEEADIIKQEGNVLYALSRYGGLAVVDITDPDHLKLLGRKRTDGIPFEMYVRNGRAYVMLNEFGHYVKSNGSPYGRWVDSSEILALDVSNPAAITELTHFDVPGSIADSRIVGDALYLVTYENGYCWNCNTLPSTIVTSFNVAGAAIAKVDQLAYSAPDKSYSGWQRSVSATNERLYIAGPEWNWTPGTQNGHSVIQVVDIKDPTGKLVKGADVTDRRTDQQPLADGRVQRRAPRRQPARQRLVGTEQLDQPRGRDVHDHQFEHHHAARLDRARSPEARVAPQRPLRRRARLRHHRRAHRPALHDRPREPGAPEAGRSARDARLGLLHGAQGRPPRRLRLRGRQRLGGPRRLALRCRRSRQARR